MSAFVQWLQHDTAGLVTVAVLGIALLLWLIMKVKLEPFVALLVAGFVVALVGGIPATEIVGTTQRSETVGLTGLIFRHPGLLRHRHLRPGAAGLRRSDEG